MNKQTLFAAMILSSVIANAQDVVADPTVVKNKKGQDVLPKAGDIALGFNAVPVIDFLAASARLGSNQASPTSANASSFTQNAGNQIVGKYFLDDKTAVRVRFGFNTLSSTQTNLVQDSKARYNASLTGLPEEVQAANLLTLEDKRFARTNTLAFAVGYEKRRGYRRLVGFYGAEIGISRVAQKENYYYANGFSQDYSAQFTNATAGFNTVTNASLINNTTRILETETPTQWGIGARGFIGIEYFVFAKISIAAEYGFGYSYSRNKATKTKQETYSNTSTGPVVIEEEFDTRSPNTLRGFGVDNGINSTLNRAGISGSTASISLLFHF